MNLTYFAAEPIFSKELEDTHANVGNPVRLECRNKGKPTPKIEWFVDEDKIKEGNRFNFVHEEPDVYALCISKCVIEDEGEYMCKATNRRGTCTTVAELTVDGKMISCTSTFINILILIPRLINKSSTHYWLVRGELKYTTWEFRLFVLLSRFCVILFFSAQWTSDINNSSSLTFFRLCFGFLWSIVLCFVSHSFNLLCLNSWILVYCVQIGTAS